MILLKNDFYKKFFRNFPSESSVEPDPLGGRRGHPGPQPAHGHGPKSHRIYRLSGNL